MQLAHDTWVVIADRRSLGALRNACSEKLKSLIKA